VAGSLAGAASVAGSGSAAGASGSVAAGLETPSDAADTSPGAWASACGSTGPEASGGLPAGVSLLIRWSPLSVDSIEASRPPVSPSVRPGPAAPVNPVVLIASTLGWQGLPCALPVHPGALRFRPAPWTAVSWWRPLRQAPVEGARLPPTLDLSACSCSLATTPSWAFC
jgi:hypothetical protein